MFKSFYFRCIIKWHIRNVSGKDQISCGSIDKPCRSLSFTINQISRHNDKIYLTASPIKKIRYTLENPIVIKHSLTVIKFPANSLNPVITYDFNVSSNREEFYAFRISQYVVAPDILTLDIKSVNFDVNIFTIFPEVYEPLPKELLLGNISGFQLWLSISDSIISSPCHTINLSDISGSGNVSIHVKDSVVENGGFMFQTRRDRCEHMEHIKNTIEINNVTIHNTENVALSVNGCFNVSIEKLTFINITWKNPDFFTFTGSALNIKNVLINNILANSYMTNNKSLFLIYGSVGEIQNMLIKYSAAKSTLIKVKNSIFKILNIKMIGNSFGNFVRADKSSFCVRNMTLSENNFTATLYSVKLSNMTLSEGTFYRNNIGRIVYIQLNSKVLITNNSLTGNKIYKNAYSISRSHMKLNNIKFLSNKINSLVLAEIQSRIFIKNLTLTNNHITGRTTYNISIKSKLTMHNVDISRSNCTFRFLTMTPNSSAIIQNNTLTENNFGLDETVYGLSENSTIHLSNIVFIRNRMDVLLYLNSSSSATIQNNTLTENTFGLDPESNSVGAGVYILYYNSTIQLKNAMFNRNRIMHKLLLMSSSSKAIIQNTILTENNVSSFAYYIVMNSSIQLSNAVFIRNRMKWLFRIYYGSSAFIQNNTLTENNFGLEVAVYEVIWHCSIQLSNVAFIQNRINLLLLMTHSCSAIIQNSTLIQNNASSDVYKLFSNSTIQLKNMTFMQNSLLRGLLNMVSNCSAELIDNTMVGNNKLDRMLFAHSSALRINTIFIKNNTFSQLIWVAECNVSFDSIKVRDNKVTYGMIYIGNTAGSMVNTFIESYDCSMAFAVTVTWTYLGNRYYPFEIANIIILWSNELLSSARPIIQVSGKVFLSNVKLLVTSLSEIEVLRYSTRDVQVLTTGIDINNNPLKTLTNVYNISSLIINCAKANVKHIRKTGTFRCIPCARGLYTLSSGLLNLSASFESKKSILPENNNFTCFDCPAGANCTLSIKSMSNFYGYKTNEQKLKFLACPRSFCCTGSQCNTIKSCNKNRIGTLCGKCIDSHAESFITADCVPKQSCRNFAKFWLVYCIYALTLATVLYYMEYFVVLIKTACSNICKIFQPCQKWQESECEIEMVIGINKGEENPPKVSHFTVSGIFALLVSFYQIKELMSVDLQYKNLIDLSLITFISKSLNLEVVAITYSSYCPMKNLDAVSKNFIKTYLLTATLLTASLINYVMSRIYHCFSFRPRKRSELKPSDRLRVCFIRILMLSYKNMATVSLIFLNCVEVSGVRVLYMKGDMDCYQWWQIVIGVFFFTWILFFPLSLKFSFNMFMKDKISFQKFIWCLLFPFAVAVNYLRSRNVVFTYLENNRNMSEVKKTLSEIFVDSYRPKADDSREETVFYETWRLYQRVLLAIVATFCINPIEPVTFMTPTIILIAISYFMIRPYKPEMYVLHWMEIFSILGYFLCLCQNMFRGFLYVYNINDEDSVKLVWLVFAILDLIFSPILLLICFFIIKPIYSKVKCGIISFNLTLRRKYDRIFSRHLIGL